MNKYELMFYNALIVLVPAFLLAAFSGDLEAVSHMTRLNRYRARGDQHSHTCSLIFLLLFLSPLRVEAWHGMWLALVPAPTSKTEPGIFHQVYGVWFRLLLVFCCMQKVETLRRARDRIYLAAVEVVVLSSACILFVREKGRNPM